MQQLLTSALLISAFFSTFPVNVVKAAECTDAEWANSESTWRWAATTSACAQYATGSNYVSAPCTAKSCVKVMEQVGKELPDCTVGGINNKVQVQNAMTVCNGKDLIATKSPIVPTDFPPSQTLTPLPSVTPSPASGENAAETTGGSTEGSVASPVVSLPGSNIKCTDSQVSMVVSLYTEASKASSCAPNAIINPYSIYIYATCRSSCAKELESLASNLPDCYYEYEYSNKKAALLEKIKDCSTSSYVQYISTSVYVTTRTSATSGASSGVAHQLVQALGLVLLVVSIVA